MPNTEHRALSQSERNEIKRKEKQLMTFYEFTEH